MQDGRREGLSSRRRPSGVAKGTLLALALTIGGAGARSFHIDYSARPEPADLLAFDLSILSAETEADLAPKQAAGGKALGYLSLVELRPGTEAARAAEGAEVPILGENPRWGSSLADVADPRWKTVVLETLAPALAAKGFDGFFLDTADSAALLAAGHPGRADEFSAALVVLVKALDAQFPDKEIVINRGFDLLPRLGDAVDGVLVESVYRSFEGAEYVAVPASDSEALETKIRALRESGMPVYAVDYAPPADRELAEQTAGRLAALGAEALVTTPRLDGVSLAPLRRELRKVLVLYGWDETEKRPMWPIDTMTASRLQMPLEWMGYECEYLHVAKQEPMESLAGHYAGVIFDAELEFPYDKELRYAEWAVRQRDEGVKLLFAAEFPFVTDDAMEEVAKGLDLRGSCQSLPGLDEVDLVSLDESVMNFEAEVRPHRAPFFDLRAPQGSKALLTLRGMVGGRSVADYEPVFVAPWGGALLEPYATFTASPDHSLSLFDPFAFLGEVFPAGDFPAPDPTTRQGLRVFASHIDGDGLASLSETRRGATCSEVVRDRILKVFPIPVTVSVIEANTRATEVVLAPEDRGRYEEIARSMFALPNVQAASHTYSHPYLWVADDPDYQNLYETDRLVLAGDEALYNSQPIDYRREIAGSIEYIERELLPEGKKVELLLWSGNCRPPAEAIRIVRELGIENMNGGDTIVSSRYRCLSAVAPRTMPWLADDLSHELQVFAPNQNEYVYTHDWRGPFYGGFSSVIETFEMTEEPRRVKPVNIYYHFYSAANLGALRALEKVHAWAMTQPLHATTAAELAAMLRDSRGTALYQNPGGRDWTVVNGGRLRTLRVPAALGLPDMARSEGVLGYAEDGGQVYIHTDGRPRARLVLETSRPPAEHLRLVTSTADLEFARLTEDAAEFSAGGFNTVNVTLGGVAPVSSWALHVGEAEPRTLEADAEGRIAFDLPPGSRVRIGRPAVALTQPAP